ncbi:MAG: M61 family metallopeptidase [Pirellulaceae bacterium]|nr:M61 family metallopeptidase [Pirellulaceae bacterium]
MSGLVRCLAVGFIWLAHTTVYVDAGAVQYRVTIDAPHTHYVQVEAKIVPKQAGDIELFMPVWTPGSYLVREYARQVDSFVAVGADNKPLAWSKTTKNRWKISGVAAEGFTVRYRVYCNELSVRTNFVDADFGMLAPAATFMTCSQLLADEHTVQLQLPAVWRQSLTAMEHPVGAAAHTYRASNFDELVDSPIFVGNPQVHPFRVGDAEHFLVNQGGDPYWNGEAAAADVAKIVAEHQQMWGAVPYKRYYFFNIIAESGGGLEHNNSTVLITSRWSFRNPKNYKKWLGLVSHEFFHVWNVRRLRPRALAHYDYENEVYFDELWVSEGITSYYDELALVRAGVISSKDYLAALSKQIETLQTGPGRLKQSLVESSRDAWIKFYRPDENSSNTSVNYYIKGAIVGFLLDAHIRQRTNNQKSLDDVMRGLYQRYAEKDGFTNHEITLVASEVAGSNMQSWFDQTVNSTTELDYQPALDWLGMVFKASPAEEKVDEGKEADKPKAGEAAAQPEKTPEAWTGVTLDAKLFVTRIVEDSPAYSAGLNVGDELIGVDGFRLTEPLEERLKQYNVSDTVKIHLARRGKLIEVPMILAAKPPAAWKLEPAKEPTPAQRENFASWLK